MHSQIEDVMKRFFVNVEKKIFLYAVAITPKRFVLHIQNQNLKLKHHDMHLKENKKQNLVSIYKVKDTQKTVEG